MAIFEIFRARSFGCRRTNPRGEALQTFRELIDSTDWSSYAHRSGNAKCRDCMVHCGYEPTAVRESFGSWRGFGRTARLTVAGPRRPKKKAAPTETCASAR